MTYVDRTLNCVDCGVEFIHSAADQEYYVQKGFSSDPKRCTSCRASRRSARDGGYDVREIGGPRGYERGDDRPHADPGQPNPCHRNLRDIAPRRRPNGGPPGAR